MSCHRRCACRMPIVCWANCRRARREIGSRTTRHERRSGPCARPRVWRSPPSQARTTIARTSRFRSRMGRASSLRNGRSEPRWWSCCLSLRLMFRQMCLRLSWPMGRRGCSRSRPTSVTDSEPNKT